MTTINHAQLDWNEAGTPVSDQFDDVYFSNVNGLEETRYVFLTQNHLPQRWQSYEKRRFVLGETGFGTGLNFLAAWQWFEQFRQQNPDAPLKELHFISFEKYPLNIDDLVKAHQAWPELAHYAKQLQAHYPIAVPECHRIVLAGGMITLDLWFGDIKDCLPQVPCGEAGIIDAWFLDGFAPSKNPEMWNQQLFDGMAKLAKTGGTCATFTSAGFVRRGLIEAGFEMKKVKGFGTKREMIAGHLPKRVSRGNIKPWFARSHAGECNDIAIIGGGIASATLAKQLAQRGKKVTLYCQDARPAQGASGNRQGAVYPLLNHNHSGVSRVFAASFLFARQFVTQMAQQHSFDHSWCGVTQLMWNESATEKLKRIVAAEFNPQLICELDQQQTAERVGLPTACASVDYPLGGWLSPSQLTQAILNELEQSGALTCHYQHQVTNLTWLNNTKCWQLSSSQGEFQHQVVVLANGHEFDRFAQSQSLPLAKVKGQVSHIPTTPELSKLNTVLCYDGYMTPCNPNNQQHCIGASYDRTHIDQQFDPQAQQDNAEKLAQCLPSQTWPHDVDVSANQSRQGVRCVSRDHLPFIGNVGDFNAIVENYRNLAELDEQHAEPVANYQQLYCLVGLGSRGLSSAPLMAELLASHICADPLPLAVDLLEALHPSRMWVRKLRKGKALSQA